MKIKFQKPYCTSTRHTQSYPRVSIDYYMKCRWSSSDKPFKTEIWIYRPSFNPRGHNENSESLLHFCKIIYMSNLILEYLLSTPENVDVVQMTNFTEKMKRRFSTLIWSLRAKWKFRNLIAHLQHISLAFFLKCWWSLSDKTTLENVFFFTPIWPQGTKWKF